MTSHAHEFDAGEGGAFRISLRYDAATAAGKTAAHTDTYHGRFVKLVTNEQVVEVLARRESCTGIDKRRPAAAAASRRPCTASAVVSSCS
jgi:hypothetical protein